MVVAAWQVLRVRYQRTHIALLGQHLANLQLERHMETLTEGYTRAIHEKEKTRQIQVLETYAQTERARPGKKHSLADTIQKQTVQTARRGQPPYCGPYEIGRTHAR